MIAIGLRGGEGKGEVLGGEARRTEKKSQMFIKRFTLTIPFHFCSFFRYNRVYHSSMGDYAILWFSYVTVFLFLFRQCDCCCCYFSSVHVNWRKKHSPHTHTHTPFTIPKNLMKIEMEYYKSHSLNARTHTHTNTHMHTVPFVSFVRSLVYLRVRQCYCYYCYYSCINAYELYMWMCACARALSHSFSRCFCATILSMEIHQHKSLLYDFYSRYCCCCHFFPFEIFQKKFESNQIKSNFTAFI